MIRCCLVLISAFIFSQKLPTASQEPATDAFPRTPGAPSAERLSSRVQSLATLRACLSRSAGAG